VYIVGRSSTQSWRAGAVAALGIGAGTLVHICAAALGLSAILAASATAFTAVKFVGAAYLLYVGISLIRTAGRVRHWRMSTSGAPIRIPDLSARPFNLVAEHTFALSPAELYEAWTVGFDKWFSARSLRTISSADPQQPGRADLGDRRDRHRRIRNRCHGQAVRHEWRYTPASHPRRFPECRGTRPPYASLALGTDSSRAADHKHENSVNT
jgi:hypothetical protein